VSGLIQKHISEKISGRDIKQTHDCVCHDFSLPRDVLSS